MPQHVAKICQFKPIIGDCATCPFKGKKVGSRGDPRARIVVVGEAPGSEERAYNLPLVGPSGWVFWHNVPQVNEAWLRTDFAGVDDRLSAIVMEYESRGELLVLNAMQCKPKDKGNIRDEETGKLRPITPLEVKQRKIDACIQCQGRLLKTITEHPRDLIITMGNFGTASVLNQWNVKIMSIRGQLIKHPISKYGVLPVIHPAALLRGTGNYRQFNMDMYKGFKLVETGEWTRPKPFKTLIMDNVAKVKQVVKRLLHSPYIACDIETSGLERYRELLSIGLSNDGKVVYIVPGEFLQLLKPLYASKKTKWIWHNGKFDITFFRRSGIMARVDEDTMLQSYCLDESSGIHDLETVAKDLLNVDPWKHLLNPYRNKKHPDKGLAAHYFAPRHLLYEYQGFDVSYTWQIWEIQRARLNTDRHLVKLYYELLIPASEMLWWVEDRGMWVNREQVEKNRIYFLGKYIEAIAVLNAKLGHTCFPVSDMEIMAFVQQIREKRTKKKLAELIREAMNVQWNPGSQLQMATVLYDICKLPNKHQRSTDKKVLQSLSPKDKPHPVVEAILGVRKAAKALSTYVTSLERQIYPDGRIHPTFKLHGTRTGRLSASWNTQNIPRLPELRATFEAERGLGLILLDVDENQAELRSLATLSRDPKLLGIYNSTDRSLHHETAITLFGESYSDPQKMRAKAVNFGIVYGRTAASIAEEFQITVREAQRYIDGWAKGYPGAWKYIQWCRSAPRNGWTLITPFGRKKRHWIVTRENLSGLENEAANFPHQSIASDICLRTATRVIMELRAKGVYIINLVHDSILCECPDSPELINWASKLIVDTFQQVAREIGIKNLPWKAEMKKGQNWGYLK